MLRFFCLTGVFALLGSFLATDAHACGGHWCRWCWHHRHVVVAPQPTHYALPLQYQSQSSSDSNMASRSLVDNIRLAVELVGLIRSNNTNQPSIGGGNSGNGGGNSMADYDRLSRRIDELQKASEKNAGEIRNLVESESAIANHVQDDLDKISERLDKLEQSRIDRDKELAKQIAESLKGELGKEMRNVFIAERLNELESDLVNATRQLDEFTRTNPNDKIGTKSLETRKKELEEKIGKLKDRQTN
jgi:ElaB/YqjD/DUF883 family membrane-anchored ribosome-binding protein